MMDLQRDTTARIRRRTWFVLGLAAATVAGLIPRPAQAGDIRVQDIARLQGQRTNALMGYGLVVGLNGTGDGPKYFATMRALMRLHQRYHAPVLTDADLKGNNNVALVVVEARVPEFGARAGQTVDVTVSCVGAAKSLAGGRLLTTPLQYAMFDEQDPATQFIMALAGGTIHVPDAENPTRGVIGNGATLEEDFFYSFIDHDRITLVLDDSHAGWPWAHMVARAVNHEMSSPVDPSMTHSGGHGRRVVDAEYAVAIGPKNIVVRIPHWELVNPSGFISRILQTPLFMLPEQAARVIINRTTNNVSFTGAVRVSPTILQIPGVGTVLIGKPKEAAGDEAEPGAAMEAVEFEELLQTLSAIQVTPEQLVNAIEHLHKTGTLHAQLQYE